MLNPEKYFENIYEYVDLWVGGFIAAYCSDFDAQTQQHVRSRMVESVLSRIDVINELRSTLGLEPLSIDDSYDYYINNLPDYSDSDNSIDLESYDHLTAKYQSMKETLTPENADIKIYLILMGAPDVFLKNSDPIQRRIEMANKLFVEGGYNPMKPKEIENLLIRMLVVSSDF